MLQFKKNKIMEKKSPKKENEKTNENYTSNKTEDNISIDIENKIIKKDSKKKSKNQEEEKNPLNNSLTDNQYTNENKTYKSNSFDKQDMSEDNLMTIPSNKKYRTKTKVNSNFTQSFTKHYETMLEYEKRRLDKIVRLRNDLEKIEIKKLKQKPEISKYSKQLIRGSRASKESILQKMKEEEEKTKMKRKMLAEKIKEERAKRKVEQEKRPDYKIKKTKVDKKFNKFYTNMIEKDKQKKEKFAKFTEIVKDYEMRECVFQPNVTDFDENKYKNLNSDELITRLYDEEVKKRIQKKKDLEKKYRPSFKPELMANSLRFIQKHKNKFVKKKTESRNVLGDLGKLENRLNNSMQKRTNRNYKLKDTEKNDKSNVSDIDLDNKSVDNIYVNEIKNEIIKNHLKKAQNSSNKKEKDEQNTKQNDNEN